MLHVIHLNICGNQKFRFGFGVEDRYRNDKVDVILNFSVFEHFGLTLQPLITYRKAANLMLLINMICAHVVTKLVVLCMNILYGSTSYR